MVSAVDERESSMNIARNGNESDAQVEGDEERSMVKCRDELAPMDVSNADSSCYQK